MLTIFTLAILALIMFTTLFLKFNPQFGGRHSSEEKSKLQASKNWKGSSFKNLEITTLDFAPSNIPSFIKDQITNNKIRRPEKAIPIDLNDLALFNKRDKQAKFLWFGHSTILLQLNGFNLLVDPMFGDDVTPIAPIPSKRFSEINTDIIDHLPEIDLVLFTHDHYDHLDYESVKKIQSKVNKYFVPLGFSKHLTAWDVPKDQITELDWWDKINFNGVEINFTPSRHYSGRGLFDRAESLWGGWVFQSNDLNIIISGDGGYGEHFKEIGRRFGSFDWAFMECGQYNFRWHQNHLYPEESVQAAFDLNAKLSFPIHWAGFKLALHPWKEPVERFVKEAKKEKLDHSTPEILKMVKFGAEPIDNNWYEVLK